MKKLVSLILSLTLALSLAACGGDPGAANSPAQNSGTPAQEETVDVVVFAAASMEATLTQIAQQYKETAPNVNLIFTFDSSGTLRTQIQEGAVCDLFISAAQKQMNQLDAADTTGANADGHDFVLSDSRIDLVENKVVLAVPDDNPKDIQSFADLAADKLELLCLGNDDVPVGAYSIQILESLGIDIAALEGDGKVTYASNVSEVANQVKEGAVDCGIIYATDAFTYALTVVDQAAADMCSQVIYPAAVMKCGGSEASQAAAQDFLDYLHTDESAISILEGVGFTVL
nr:molybdate ABC transporter substrate-binding protein [uncultured Flavonifractor sp.]